MNAATKKGNLTKPRLQQVMEEIRGAGDIARKIAGPDQRFSYAAMAGSLSAVLTGLVRDLAGESAVQQIEVALKDAFGERA